MCRRSIGGRIDDRGLGGSPTWAFRFFTDAVQGIVSVAERFNEAEAVNLGSGEEVRMRDLTEIIAHLTHFDVEIFWDCQRPSGQPRRNLAVNRTVQLFSSRASTHCRGGPSRIVDWGKRALARRRCVAWHTRPITLVLVRPQLTRALVGRPLGNGVRPDN